MHRFVGDVLKLTLGTMTVKSTTHMVVREKDLDGRRWKKTFKSADGRGETDAILAVFTASFAVSCCSSRQSCNPFRCCSCGRWRRGRKAFTPIHRELDETSMMEIRKKKIYRRNALYSQRIILTRDYSQRCPRLLFATEDIERVSYFSGENWSNRNIVDFVSYYLNLTKLLYWFLFDRRSVEMLKS